jgi:shikimate dehydrogenase
VTIPHKEKVIPLLDRLDPSAEAVGAVNCIVAEGGELTGHNTDIAGVAAALSGVELEDRKAAIVGAGGAARAAIHYLRECDARSIALLVRDPAKAASLQAIDPARIQAWPLAEADEALGSAAAIVNASPMGMTGAAAMSEELLEAIRRHADGAALFDMVYNPLQTLFLECAARHGGTPVDGLTMLIGQAAGAFRLFFGEEPPPAHGELRATLAG